MLKKWVENIGLTDRAIDSLRKWESKQIAVSLQTRQATEEEKTGTHSNLYRQSQHIDLTAKRSSVPLNKNNW